MKYYEKHKPTVICAIVIIAFAFFAIAIQACKPSRMNGSYTANVTFLFFSGQDKINFSNDKTFTEGTPNTRKNDLNKGTYEIDGDKLKLKWNKGGYKATAKLSKDHESFVIKKATGIAGLGDGTKFKKDK